MEWSGVDFLHFKLLCSKIVTSLHRAVSPDIVTSIAQIGLQKAKEGGAQST